MEVTWKAKDGKYFWSTWFQGQSLRLLSLAFILLSAADLLATLNTMPHGVKEGNALAQTVLHLQGVTGFVVYKALLVTLALGVIWFVDRRNPRLARGVLWGAILLMTFIALLHLSIIGGLLS